MSALRAEPLKISENSLLQVEDSDHKDQYSGLGLVAVNQGDVIPRQHLAMSRDTFGCHDWEAGHATSI